MTGRKDRSIALVRIADAEQFADSIAAACGGRERALQLLEAAVVTLRCVP